MKLVSAMRQPRFLLIACLAAVCIFVLYGYMQVLGIWQNFDLFLTATPPEQLGLYVLFSALFGVTLSYMIFLTKQPKVCAIGEKSAPGLAGTFISLFVVQCPACVSFLALFLPLGAITFLAAYSLELSGLSIALLLLTLFRLGAFTGEKSRQKKKKKR